MKRKNLFNILFAALIVLCFMLLIQYSRQFIWVSYKDESKNFSIDYPATWTHEYPKFMGKIIWNPKTGNYEDDNKYPIDRWYIEKPRVGAGKFSGDELILKIYDSPNNNQSDFINKVATESASYNAKNIEITITGTQVKGYEQPGHFSVGPLEHEGKFYYFIGTDNSVTRKLLSTFKFIQ